MAIRAYEEEKRREEWYQKIEEIINLIDSFIQNPISSIKTPQLVTTKEKESVKRGLRHCAANRKRKKRKGPFVWPKSKSRLVIEVGQTEAIEGGLNCDNRLATYEQSCQHFLMFDYDPQEGELQVKTWDPGIT
ncbi:putative serine/threonine/dual specificity protein kinase, catalytic domain-containing protein [Tanacetum coccineum]